MKIELISLNNLKTNSSNDRHGELISEDKAIEWLLSHHATHMRNLTKDIVQEGEIYEPPLIHKDGKKFTVYDGNRRVTCLKLLQNPNSSPTNDWRLFFQNQRKAWSGQFPQKIFCQIEEDKDRIDEILYRRHTGGQSGVGQSQWDAVAKSNFVKRTGKKTGLNVAEEIETKLKETDHIGEGIKVPRANLNRLLSSEAFRNRVGITVKGKHLEFTHDENKVIEVLTQIVNDLSSKTIVLDDIWNNQGKKSYLDSLEKLNLLPTLEETLEENTNFKKSKIKKPKKKKKPTSKQIRNTLIRKDIDYGIPTQLHTQRALDIWEELQHHLKFGHHNNAISVLFRVIIEISLKNYITQKKIKTIHPNDKLYQKFGKVADHMLSAGTISKDYHQGLNKFKKAEEILSSNTFNKYVHSDGFFPSDIHLKSMWDNLSIFISNCLKV